MTNLIILSVSIVIATVLFLLLFRLIQKYWFPIVNRLLGTTPIVAVAKKEGEGKLLVMPKNPLKTIILFVVIFLIMGLIYLWIIQLYT